MGEDVFAKRFTFLSNTRRNPSSSPLHRIFWNHLEQEAGRDIGRTSKAKAVKGPPSKLTVLSGDEGRPVATLVGPSSNPLKKTQTRQRRTRTTLLFYQLRGHLTSPPTPRGRSSSTQRHKVTVYSEECPDLYKTTASAAHGRTQKSQLLRPGLSNAPASE